MSALRITRTVLFIYRVSIIVNAGRHLKAVILGEPPCQSRQSRRHRFGTPTNYWHVRNPLFFLGTGIPWPCLSSFIVADLDPETVQPCGLQRRQGRRISQLHSFAASAATILPTKRLRVIVLFV